MSYLVSLLLFCVSTSFAARDYVEGMDPDEFFDNVGDPEWGQIQTEMTPMSQAEKQRFEGRGVFGGDGYITTSIGTAHSIVRGAAIWDQYGLLGSLLGVFGLELYGAKYIGVGRTEDASGKNKISVIQSVVSGNLNPYFGASGIKTFSIGSHDEIAHAMILQSDGRIVVAGRTQPTALDNNFLIVRLLTSGGLDTSFNTLGYATVSFGTQSDIARAIKLDSLGRPVVGGYSWDGGNFIFAMARLTTNGVLDTTFNTTGLGTTDINGATSGANALAIDALGRAVLSGPVLASTWDSAVARFQTNGTLDSTFNTTGLYLSGFLPAANDQPFGNGIYVPRAGVVLGGSRVNAAGDLDIMILRLGSNGTLDTTFSTIGWTSISIGTAADQANAMVMQMNQKAILGGYTNNGSNKDFALLRFQTNGALDTLFNTAGKTTVGVGPGNDEINALAISSTNNNSIIVAAGEVQNAGSNFVYSIARIAIGGTLARSGIDLAFLSGEGRDDDWPTRNFTIDNGESETAKGVVEQADGNFIVVATGSHGQIMRLLPSGAFDTTFYTTGKRIGTWIGTAHDKLYAADIQNDGKILAGGLSYNSENGIPQLVVMRLNTNGDLDTAFNTIGKRFFSNATTDCYIGSVSLMSDQRIMWGAVNISQKNIGRINTNGTLDTTFFTIGISIVSGSSGSCAIPSGNTRVVVDSLGRGIALEDGCNTGWLNRFISNGNLDTSFATGGIKIEFMPTAARAIQWAIPLNDNRLLFTANGTQGGYLARLETNGNWDTSFGTTGYTTFSFSSGGSGSSTVKMGILDVDGSFLVAGQDRNADFAVARFSSNGDLDTTFATTARITSAIGTNDINNSIMSTRSGAIYSFGGSNNTDISILRYWP